MNAVATIPSTSKKITDLKAAIYIRVSTHWQVDKDSLQVQQRELIAYCQLVLGINDYVVFEDAGYSAKNTDRPDFQKMMARIRSGEFSHVLVWKIDRVSRNLLDFASMYAELQNLGVIFISKNEQFDTSTAIGEAMLKIILVFAELERNMTSERVTAVMLSRANNGKWNGGRVPYGYAHPKDSTSFSIDDTEGEVAKRIFQLYEEHQSCLYISNMLNSEKILTRAGGTWNSTSIHKILTNPFYYGAYRYNIRKGTDGQRRSDSEWVVVEDHHPPLISKERFDVIQYRLKQNKRGGNQRGISVEKKNVHIFSGLLVCGHCSDIMTATPGNRRADGWTPSNYACMNRRKGPSSCKSKYVSDVIVAPFVLSLISNILTAKDKIGSRTEPATLEKRLLSGAVFCDVKHIKPDGLNQLLSILKSGTSGLEYSPEFKRSQPNDAASEVEFLKDQRRKKEIALRRLKSLFLYGSEEIPEKEFILEQKKLIDDLNAIDAKLLKLDVDNAGLQSLDDAFVEKTSYFIMVEHIMNGDRDDPVSFIRNVDLSVVKSFLNTIIRKIIILSGKVSSIEFKNGITLEFSYE